MTRWRAAAVAASALCFLGSACFGLRAEAADGPGSRFYGYTLLGQASGLELVEDRPTANSHPEADAEVPLSRVSLLSGPVGYALGSIAWPSALVANAGDLAVFAGNGQVPEQLGPPLDEPVRAEARTGGPDEVTNEDYPGATMHARVRPAEVVADAVVDGGQAGAATGFGATETHSASTVGDASVSVTARSSTRDVSLAGGQVRIAAVLSRATAGSDGTTGSASGATTVSGMTVAGVPVTVDGSGVHVAGNGSAVDTRTVATALASAGMRIVLSGPTQTRSGSTVSYDAGSLVVYWNPSPDESLTVRLGGARVTAGAYLADPTASGSAGAPGAPAAPSGVGAVPATSGSFTAPAPSSGALGQQPGGQLAPAVASPAARVSPLLTAAERVPAGAVALAVLGALFLLAGLLRLPRLALLAATPPCRDRSPT